MAPLRIALCLACLCGLEGESAVASGGVGLAEDWSCEVDASSLEAEEISVELLQTAFEPIHVQIAQGAARVTEGAVHTMLETSHGHRSADLPRVECFDLAAYMGKWFLVLSNRAVYEPYQETCGECVVSEYTALPETSGWDTTHTTFTCTGAVVSTGYSAANPEITGDFHVRLEFRPSPPLQFESSNYAIVSLGPIVDGLYEYDIVTTPAWERLYVRTRNRARFSELYKEEVVGKLRALGFSDEVFSVGDGCGCS